MRVPFKFTMVGAAFAALALGYGVWAQPVVQNTYSGNECWNTGQGPGGPSTGFVCLSATRAGVQTVVVSGNAAAPPVTTTGCTAACATVANQNFSTYMWVGTAPTAWAITLPNPANDGQVVTVGTNTTLTTLVTVTSTNTPQNQVALSPAYSAQTVTAGTSAAWVFNLAALTWYRLR